MANSLDKLVFLLKYTALPPKGSTFFGGSVCLCFVLLLSGLCLFPLHGVVDGVVALLAGAYLDYVLNVVNEHLAVAVVAGVQPMSTT